MNKFEFVILAGARAKQLQAGCTPKVEGSDKIARLATARREIRAVAEYEYVIVNDELDACVDRLRSIVLAERARPRVMAPTVARIVGSFTGKD